MAWSDSYILNRAKEFVREYADENRISVDDVQSGFEEFCIDSLSVDVTDSVSTIANQREYNVDKVVRVVSVKYGAQVLRVNNDDSVSNQSYWQDGSRVRLNFDPASGVTLTISGQGVPNAISTMTLKPSKILQDAVAYKVAQRVLERYGDAQAVQRAQVFATLYDKQIQRLKTRRGYNPMVRGEHSPTGKRISLI